MKSLTPWLVVALLIVFGSITAQIISPNQKPSQDPVIILHLTLPQTTNVVYTLRNSTILDAKTANELADLIVTQASDTMINKLPTQTPRHK